jgi:nucleotide-binding universal stress UspA family protein
MRKPGGGGHWANIGKIVVFAVLIAGGLWALWGTPTGSLGDKLTPFFAAGGLGLIQAMGFTFIALQGFDLIAAVAGEIREPQRNIPRAMLGSLGIALAIYLPLLFVVSTVGVAANESVTAASRADPEGIIAHAAERYLGPFGYWFVVVAAILSMLSALHANLFAASRVARAMALDRTLPRRLSRVSARFQTPIPAVLATAGIVVSIILLIPDVAAAGAAASLIFLITFALAHAICILARHRGGGRPASFRTPWFPLVPVAGVATCVALAAFQGVAVPSAGAIASAWLVVGCALFVFLFARRARVVDALTAARDPDLVRLRGHNPLVLVPIANPANAAAMVAVANALAPPQVGRVLLLSIVVPPKDWRPLEDSEPLTRAQRVLGESLTASVNAGVYPEALTTVSAQPWTEISRVARTHRCQSLLLGLSELSQSATVPLDDLVSTIDSDVIVLRAPTGLQLSKIRRILVPIGGQGGHDQLRARLLGSLARMAEREVTFLRVLPTEASDRECERAKRQLAEIAEDAHGTAVVQVERSDAPLSVVVEHGADSDLVVLGVRRMGRRGKAFGQFTLDVARRTSCPLLLLSRRG